MLEVERDRLAEYVRVLSKRLAAAEEKASEAEFYLRDERRKTAKLERMLEQGWKTKAKHKIRIQLQRMYRVSHLVANLGWVEFNLGSWLAIQRVATAQAGWWNIPNPCLQNPVRDQMGHPVHSFNFPSPSRYRPDLVDFQALDPAAWAENCQLAFDVLEQDLGIGPAMTGRELAASKNPDKLTMMSYLSQIYEAFRKEIPAVKQKRLMNHSDEDLLEYMCPPR